MSPFAAGALAFLSLMQPDQVTITKSNQDFVIRSGAKTVRIPISAKAEATQKPLTSVERMVFRKDDNYAVWDARGLSVRKGGRTLTTLLPEIALTPRLFEHDDIVLSRALMALSLRSPYATTLSGAKRIGSNVFFLIRWEDGFAQPWLEALIKVGLDDSSVRPALLGRFEGYSLETGSERLKVIFGRIAAVTQRQDGTWGRATFDPDTGKFGFETLGEGLQKYIPLAAGGCSIEQTDYGSSVLSSVNIRDPSKKVLLESRDSIRFVGGDIPYLALASEAGGDWVHNLETGAILRIPPKAQLTKTGLGLLIWTPATNPLRATLYEPGRFEELAVWTPEIQAQQEEAARKSATKSNGKHSRHRRKSSH